MCRAPFGPSSLCIRDTAPISKDASNRSSCNARASPMGTGPRLTRARVTCGRNRRGSGSIPCVARAVSTRSCNRRSCTLSRTPIHTTRARSVEGNAPAPPTSMVNRECRPTAVARALPMAGMRSTVVSPIKRRVAWSCSVGAQRSSSSRRAARVAASSSRRTTEGSAIATKSLAESARPVYSPPSLTAVGSDSPRDSGA